MKKNYKDYMKLAGDTAYMGIRANGPILWAFLNKNLVSSVLAAAVGATLSYRLTKTYREKELKDLQDDYNNSREDNRELSISSEKLKSTNTRLISQISILNSDLIMRNNKLSDYRSKYRYCNDQLKNSWCFFGRPETFGRHEINDQSPVTSEAPDDADENSMLKHPSN